MEYTNAKKKIKLSICLETITVILSFVSFINIFIYWGRYSVIHFFLCVSNIALCILVVQKRKNKGRFLDIDILPDTAVLKKNFDSYVKRSANWIFIAYLEFFSLLMAIISLGVNSKLSETMSLFNNRLLFLELIAYFLITNVLMYNWITKLHSFDKANLFQHGIRKLILYSALYWVVGLGFFYLFESVFVINTASFLRCVYIAIIIIVNLTVFKKYTYKNKKLFRPVVVVVCAAAFLIFGYAYFSRNVWLTQPYIYSVPNLSEHRPDIQYDDETGVYTITKDAGDFKILQLTDIHLGGSVLSYDKDLMALKAVYQLIDETRPDFVIVTGDLTFPVGYASFSFNNTAPVQQFAAFMRNLGIPWAFTYGNHDTENYAASSSYMLNDLYMSLSYKTSRMLLYPYVQPDITGRNNQLIELRNADGSLNQALFLIDSNAYTGKELNKYDFIHDDQVEWYKNQILRLNEEEGHTVSSMVFFHIPLQEYKEAYLLYEEGSDQVTYYFGANDEEMMGKVCCSEYPSNMFNTAVELQSTTGFFCGHDHYNNMSLEYKGIRLTYGMSIDYLAMPGIARDTAQRGGTLIIIHDNGTSDISQVPLQ